MALSVLVANPYSLRVNEKYSLHQAIVFSENFP